MSNRSRSFGQLGRLSGGIPRVWSFHKTPLGRAYLQAYRGFVARYGKPEKFSETEHAMTRAAVARGRLVLATVAWEALMGRQRHTKDSRRELLAAEKLMNRADESLSRALSDLRQALPPVPVVPVSPQAAARERAQVKLDAIKAGHHTTPRPILPADRRDAPGHTDEDKYRAVEHGIGAEPTPQPHQPERGA